MIKTNLPVILLKDLVLFPYEDVRIELKSNISKKVTKLSKLYHDSEVLVVCPYESLEENPEISDLPKIGIVGKINSIIDLPNGCQRIIISGERRVKILNYVNYSNEEDVLESIVTNITNNNEDSIEEIAYLRKLMEEIETYISKNPFISNSIMSKIRGLTSLDKITDIIANFLPLSNDKKFKLMIDDCPISRSKTLIREISIENAVIDLENKIEIDVKKELDDSQKAFLLKEKIRIIKNELGEDSSKDEDEYNLEFKIKNGKYPEKIKNKLLKELEKYRRTPQESAEINNIRSYLDYLLNIPWKNSTKDEKDLKKVEKRLDSTHFAMYEAKKRIIEYIAVKSVANNINSPIICLVGPPGIGKTTFAYSIADAVNRNFVKISLGGMSDSSELVGHRRTYLGAFPGKIITSLIKCKSNNPVILLDEVDKLKKDYKGDPASTLLDILDVSQNKKFIDNYIDEEVDLSNILFILTANDISLIPPVLLDRLEIIYLNGYSDYEKEKIAQEHIIPLLNKKYNLSNNAIKFEDNAIKRIIEEYTNEAGVRDLERNLNKIVRKVMTQYIQNNQRINTIKIKLKDIDKYLSESKNIIVKNDCIPGVVKSVASSSIGGTCINIECTSYKGTGKLIYTGAVGKITEESINVAISYIKSNSEYFKIDSSFFNNNDLHIHFTENSIPKDGPSAGTAITTAILSHIKNKKIGFNIASTGEITLTGRISKVGGIKNKLISSIRNDITTLFIPFSNKNELKDLDDTIKNKIDIIPVTDYKEIYDKIFKDA